MTWPDTRGGGRIFLTVEWRPLSKAIREMPLSPHASAAEPLTSPGPCRSRFPLCSLWEPAGNAPPPPHNPAETWPLALH